jgi:O-antigen/teichoic acid export membrane protein
MAESVTKEAKVIARHTAVYGMANVLDRAVSFIMLPVYTRYLTPADYGVLELIGMTVALLAVALGMGVEAAVSRFYFDYKDPEKRKLVVSSGLLGYSGFALIFVVILLPFSDALAGLILDSVSLGHYFVVALIGLGLSFIQPINLAYLRVQQKSGTLMLVQVAKTFFGLSLVILLVVVKEMGVYGVLLGTMLSDLVFTIFLTVFTLIHTRLRVDWTLVKGMIMFGLPLVPSNMSAYIVRASDRWFVKEYVNMASTGLYSIGYKFGTLVHQFVTSPFIQIWTPRRFEYFEKEGSDRIFARIFTYFCAVSLFVGLMISLLSKEIIQLMTTEAFWSSYLIVPVIVLAYIVFSFHYHFNVGILIKKATKYIAYVNMANAGLNIVLNFIIIRRYGVWGAAFTALICYLFKSGMTYYYANRLYPISVEWRRVSTLFIGAIGLFLAGSLIDTGSLWLNAAAKVGVGLTYPLILYWMRMFDSSEIAKIKEIIRTRRVSVD